MADTIRTQSWLGTFPQLPPLAARVPVPKSVIPTTPTTTTTSTTSTTTTSTSTTSTSTTSTSTTSTTTTSTTTSTTSTSTTSTSTSTTTSTTSTTSTSTTSTSTTSTTTSTTTTAPPPPAASGTGYIFSTSGYLYIFNPEEATFHQIHATGTDSAPQLNISASVTGLVPMTPVATGNNYQFTPAGLALKNLDTGNYHLITIADDAFVMDDGIASNPGTVTAFGSNFEFSDYLVLSGHPLTIFGTPGMEQLNWS